MNETIRALGVFLLACTLAAGSLLAVCLLVDRHYKARLAEDYAAGAASAIAIESSPLSNHAQGAFASRRISPA